MTGTGSVTLSGPERGSETKTAVEDGLRPVRGMPSLTEDLPIALFHVKKRNFF